MSTAELKRIAGAVGNLKALAIMTGVPYRSLQDYGRGLFGIPGHVADAVRGAYRRDREVTDRIIHRLGAQLDREFPNGIQSELTDPP